jgi:hypothetical protein
VSLFQLPLFDELSDGDDGLPTVEKRLRYRLNGGFQFSDHACRYCFGRVMQRVSRGEVVEVRCAECGKRAEGRADALCCCGADCGDLGYALECFKNRNVTNERPHEILVRQRAPRDVKPDEKQPARPVHINDL